LRLDEIVADLNTTKLAGLKQIHHIVYNRGMTNATTSEKIIRRHLDQPAPVSRKNADVVFAVEIGIFGGTGEA
jgi:hypothetical protein